MLPITQMPVDINPFSRPGTKLVKVKGIVLHYTASPKADADNIIRYFDNLKKQKKNDGIPDTFASAHFAVDDTQIVQGIPEDEMAYEVGAKSYTEEALRRLSSYPNNCTIGIEMCIDANGNISEKTFQNTVDLTVYLLQKHKLTVNDLWRHYDITKKICPLPWVRNPNEWERFKAEVARRMGQKAPSPSVTAPEMSIVLHRRDRGEAVKALQEQLNKIGFSVGVADGIFGEKTEEALKAFQKANPPLTIDGVYGPATKKILDEVVAKLDKKEEEYMIPVKQADKIIALIQAEWKEKDEQIKQYQKMWQEENAKPDKCQQKLDEYHKAAEALRADIRELGDLADEVRKASGRKLVN